ncbi:MAG: metallophosphoesterase [Bacilli bacterium]|nr:metallophosphoesterase [Bacilli bacterium]
MAKKKKKKHNFFKFLFFIILLGGLIYLYGTYIEIKNYKTYDYKIENKKITDNFDGFTIVHISDIHYGRIFEKEDLKKIVKMINNINPDIVVLTGDLIDKDTKMNTEIASDITKELSKINTNNGKYAISGNHDAKFDEWENIINNSGFINLNNNYDTIYNKGYDFLFIAGVSSFKDKESITSKNKNAEEFLNKFEKDGPIYNILLMHEPDYIDDLKDNKYDLILAGHSHNGQINIPFIGPVIKPTGAQKYYNEHYKINNSDLYISNGLGVSKYNYRIFNSPSFNIYRLTKSV